jgi:hypothetical protein
MFRIHREEFAAFGDMLGEKEQQFAQIHFQV